MKTRTASPAPTLSPEELTKLDAYLGDINGIVNQIRVTARSLEHEEARNIKPPEAVWEDPVFLDSCSQVLNKAGNDLWELYGKILRLMPEYKNNPTPVKS